MNEQITNTVVNATGAREIIGANTIQSLWSGYGEIVRLELAGSAYPSAVLKHIKLPEVGKHPRGWNTDLSHQRKIFSYRVEAHWYQYYAQRCDSHCPVPECLSVRCA